MLELYKKYRPKTLEQLLGQDGAVKALNTLIEKKKIPHSILITGPSGCGKTTIARILRRKVHCGETDFTEVNCADFRGIDMVREIRQRMMLAPISGKSRVWLIDEVHQLTPAAQDAFLKLLEDTPRHVYFILATTDPHKLKATIKTRCHDIAVKALSAKVLEQLVLRTAEAESIELADEVVDSLVAHSEGSARKVLVLLHSVLDIEDSEEQLQAIESSDVKAQAIEVAKLLMNPRTQWSAIAKVLKGLDDEAEAVRWLVLGYASSVLLGGGKMAPRAYVIINAFRDNFFDSKKAGLAAACYEVVVG